VSPGEISGWAARVVRAGAVRGPAGAADRLPPAGEPEDARLGVAEDSTDRPSGPKPGDPAGAVEASVFHGRIMPGVVTEANAIGSRSINGGPESMGGRSAHSFPRRAS